MGHWTYKWDWTRDGSSGQMLWHTQACGDTTSTTSHCPLSGRGVKFCVAAILLHCSVQKVPFPDPEWTLDTRRLFRANVVAYPGVRGDHIYNIQLSAKSYNVEELLFRSTFACYPS